ncbi:hypothetical protein Tco_0819947 [Tanacetum coccineum]|uniref:Uncharacterized protein n=1 Tax=Tanacetum coccineum TaxID=301880 RepID=A0ABQ5A916_9ASTR
MHNGDHGSYDTLIQDQMVMPYGSAFLKVLITPTIVTTPAVPATDEKEAIHLILTGIGDEIYSTVDACQTAYGNVGSHQRLQQVTSRNLYLPTNNNLRTSSTPETECGYTTRYRMTIDGQFRNQRAVNVAGVGTVGGSVGATVPGIRCFQMQVFVIMLENAEAKKGYKELSITKKDVLYMAKDLQEVPNADSGTDAEPLEQVQYDTDDNVFANDIQHFDQSESISNTCAVETDDSNVTPDSPDMCDNDIQDDQNDSRMTQQCPSAYTWVPKTKRKWVPKVRNESVTKKIGTTIYSLLTWMHKDMRANLSNAVQFCTKNIAVPFVMQMINLLNLLAMEIWFKGHITDQKASFPNDKRRQIDNPDPVLNVQNVSPLADTQQFSSQRSWISFRVLFKTELEKVKEEKEGFEFKLAKFEKSSKDLDALLASQVTDKSKRGFGYTAVPSPHPLILNRPTPLDLSYSGLEEFQHPEINGTLKRPKREYEWPQKLKIGVSDDEEDVESIPKEEKKANVPIATKKESVKPVLLRSVNTVRPVSTARFVNTVRPYNTAHPKPTVSCARPKTHFQNQAQRPFYKNTTLTKRSNIQNINTAKQVFNTVRPNVNTVRARGFNAVKPSACWVWRPIKPNGASLTFNKYNYIDACDTPIKSQRSGIPLCSATS